MLYTIQVSDRNYTSTQPQDIPVTIKYFHGDIYDDNTQTIKSSPLRETKTIAGILILENNQTYGRTKNKKRLLYKCIPENIHYPVFLVPYDIKLGFSKNIKNKYVTFQFDNWDNQHPHGIITEVLGNVDILTAFYEYQLFHCSINHSLSKFNNRIQDIFNGCHESDLLKQIEENIDKKYSYKIVDKTSENVFSIDPEGSLDLDDAISIQTRHPDITVVSIYIANVFVWLDTFGLWQYIQDRVSTIYLPDKNRTLLPSMLSNNLCSLLENRERYAFCMEVTFNRRGFELSRIYSICKIKVKKNYVYEESQLKYNPDYLKLIDITKKRSSNIQDSHDLVEYWMLYMNQQTGTGLYENEKGIFRVTTINPTLPQIENVQNIENMDKKTRQMLENWKTTSGNYVKFSQTEENYRHQLLGMDYYCHVTSPIRRLVDIINQTECCLLIFEEKPFSEVCHFEKEKVTEFIDYWKNKIDYINHSTKQIKKTQNECELMTKCSENRELMDNEQKGLVFDKTYSEKDQMWKYSVYLEKWKIMGKVKTDIELENYTYHQFKLYYFADEYKTKNRIRFMIC